MVAGPAELPDRAGQEWAGKTVPGLGAEQGCGPGKGRGWGGGTCVFLHQKVFAGIG